jgi:prepilin-type N-terminal cleavage/methylation domain-containing protein
MNFKHKRFGFTLIEMLVTLSIVTLLTTMVLVYSRQNESMTNLIRDSDRLVFNLHQVQNSSLLTLQPTATSVGSPTKNICGWGIYFNNDSSYTLFHDLCDSTTPGSTTPKGNNLYDSGEEYETVNVLRGVIIKHSDIQSIVFVPPNPDIQVYDGVTASHLTDHLITVQMCLAAQPDTCFVISINPAGQISKEVETTSTTGVTVSSRPPPETIEPPGSTTTTKSSCSSHSGCSCTRIGLYCSGFSQDYTCLPGEYCCCSGSGDSHSAI